MNAIYMARTWQQAVLLPHGRHILRRPCLTPGTTPRCGVSSAQRAVVEFKHMSRDPIRSLLMESVTCALSIDTWFEPAANGIAIKRDQVPERWLRCQSMSAWPYAALDWWPPSRDPGHSSEPHAIDTDVALGRGSEARATKTNAVSWPARCCPGRRAGRALRRPRR
jgi:hypothetical protein